MVEKVWETREVHVIEYYKFDELVQTHLGLSEYEIIADEELRNGGYFALGGLPSKYWSECDEEELAETLAGKKRGTTYRSGLLAHELCRRGIIPPGWWLVSVSW